MIILKENQYIKMTWCPNNRQYYENKGYVFTEYRNNFMIKAEDLPDSSPKKIKAICDCCSNEYDTVYVSYINSVKKNGKCFCKKCGSKLRNIKNQSERQLKHYLDIKTILESNGYILLSNIKDIIDGDSTMFYICPTHGVQQTTVSVIKNGRKCPRCARERTGKLTTLPKDKLIQTIESVNNNKILNPDEYENAHCKNLKIKCGLCGQIYITSYHAFKHGTTRCRHCSSCESKGEFKIREILEKNNIDYIREYIFEDCRDKYPLRFDFYLPKNNTCIEYDGEQHYLQWHDRGEFEDTKRRDIIKTNYCNKNNINLIRIPYWEKNNIEEFLIKENIIR